MNKPKNTKPGLGDLLGEVEQERQTSTGPKWEDRFKRATFHLPVETIDRLDTVAKQSGVSKARIVNQALENFLDSAT